MYIIYIYIFMYNYIYINMYVCMHVCTCTIHARLAARLQQFKSLLQNHYSGVYWSCWRISWLDMLNKELSSVSHKKISNIYNIEEKETNKGNFQHHDISIIILITILDFCAWIECFLMSHFEIFLSLPSRHKDVVKTS